MSVAQSVEIPLLICEAVLAETAFHRQSVAVVLEMISLGMLQLAFDCSSQLAALSALAVRCSDRKPDLADLCLVRMSELYPKHVVITIDERDFRVYRRNKREAIHSLSPVGSIAP